MTGLAPGDAIVCVPGFGSAFAACAGGDRLLVLLRSGFLKVLKNAELAQRFLALADGAIGVEALAFETLGTCLAGRAKIDDVIVDLVIVPGWRRGSARCGLTRCMFACRIVAGRATGYGIAD
jgi:hypothetical protein